MQKRTSHRFFRLVLWISGIWAVLLLVLQILLSPSVLNRIVDRYANDFIDGDLEFSRARIHMFRHFPSIGITLEDGSLTYPAERFDTLEAASPQGRLLYSGCGQEVDTLEATSPQGRLLYSGCGQEADTLASFSRFSAGINIASLISGKIGITHAELAKPRIFAHSYDSTSANWNIFKTSEEDTTSTALPPISVGRIRLSDNPHIVYTDSEDTIFAMIDVRKIAFDGRLDTRRASRNRIGLTFDSLLVAGRIAADTLGMKMDRHFLTVSTASKMHSLSSCMSLL